MLKIRLIKKNDILHRVTDDEIISFEKITQKLNLDVYQYPPTKNVINFYLFLELIKHAIKKTEVVNYIIENFSSEQQIMKNISEILDKNNIMYEFIE